MKLDHIAIAVRDMDEGIAVWEGILGMKCSLREHVEAEGVEVAKFVLDNCRIELICPQDPESPIAKFLQEKKSVMHHLAIAPGNFEETHKRLEDSVQFIGEPHRGSEDMLIHFIHPKSTNGVLLELCKPKD